MNLDQRKRALMESDPELFMAIADCGDRDGCGEAVAWRVSCPDRGWKVYEDYPRWAEGEFEIVPLYTHLSAPVPDGWRLISKKTCYQLANGNNVVATLAGPDAEDNAAILARLLTTPQSASGWIKCGYEYQHEDTGMTGYVDEQQIEWGFFLNNPRLQLIGPIYRPNPPADQEQSDE